MTDQGLQLVDVSTGNVTLADGDGVFGPYNGPGIAAAFTSPSSPTLAYRSSAGNGELVLWSSGTATPLLSADIDADFVLYSLLGVSPDDGHLLLASSEGATLLGSTPGGDAPHSVNFADPPLGAAADAFTSDSSHALLLTGYGSSDVTALYAVPLVGTSSVTVSKTPWGCFAGQGARVVYSENATLVTALPFLGYGTADLKVVDVSKSAPSSVLIASQANTDYFLSPAKDKVVFVWGAQPTVSEGIYVTALP